MTPQPREFTDADVDALFVPVRDIAPIIAKACATRDHELAALRRIVADQAALIARLTEGDNDAAPAPVLQ